MLTWRGLVRRSSLILHVPVVMMLGALCGVLCVSVPAQDLTEYSEAQAAWQQVTKPLGELSTADPAAALPVVEQFIAGHPRLDITVARYAYLTLARLHERASQPVKAIAALEQGATRYGAFPGSVYLRARQVELLTATGKAAEAEKLAVQHLPRYREWGPPAFIPLLEPYCQSIQAQGKGSTLPRIIQQEMLQYPTMLDETAAGNSATLWDLLIANLLDSGQEQAALSWAKARFMLCGFNEGAVQTAAKCLSRVWMARTLSPATAQAFLKAQSDAKAPNPLQAVPLPVLTADARGELLGRVAAGGTVNPKVSACLLLGQLREAMVAARAGMVENPEDVTGAREIARVFKAADLNLLRGNAFLQFWKSGEGENPLEEFMRQHPAVVVEQ